MYLVQTFVNGYEGWYDEPFDSLEAASAQYDKLTHYGPNIPPKNMPSIRLVQVLKQTHTK